MKERDENKSGCPFHKPDTNSHEIAFASESKTALRQTPLLYKPLGIIGDPSAFTSMLIDQFGDFVHYRGLIQLYLINDPVLISQVFKETHRNFNKQTSLYKRFQHALGNGLVNAEGEHWKRQRKLITPAFTPHSLSNYFSMIVAHTNTYLEAWTPLAKKSTPFDLAKEMNCLTLEIAGSALFSSSFENKSEDIHRWVKVISQFSARPPIPIIGDPKFPRPLTFKVNKVLKEFQDFINTLLEERAEAPSSHDLLSVFLNMHDEDTGEGMSKTEIAEEVLVMILGSHESSATTLSWLFYELSENPEDLQTLLSEIMTVTKGEPITQNHLEKLPFLKSLIYETLRLHPPFWFENRKVIKEVELGGVTLKKGSTVALSRYSVHRNPKHWEEPNTFKPSRFQGEEVSLEALFRTGKYVPFSSGPRVCIGRHFAMMELMIIVVTMLQRFHIQVSPNQSGDAATNLTMELKNGLQVTVSPR